MLRKKLWRTMLLYKAQFISMTIMIMLGIGVFVGFNMEWVAIEDNTRTFYDETHFADYRLMWEKSFTSEQLEKVKNISGVSDAGRFAALTADVNGRKGDSLSLAITENKNISDFIVMEGEQYDENSSDGIWLSQIYAENNDISIGDKLSLSWNNTDISGTVKGLVKSSEYLICVRDETQLMPDFGAHGFAYISPEMYENKVSGEYYPQIHILSDMDKREISQKVDEALEETMLVVPKDDVISYAGPAGESDEGKTMGLIIPVLFLLIAFLTMVTTMHRISAKEKTQIGTLKALGFKDRRILRHYTFYALFIGALGSALGIGFGFLLCWYIMNPNGAMGTYFDMPYWRLSMPLFCYAVIGGIIILLTIIGFLSVKKMLRGTAADALRPYSPKKMKAMFIERFGFFHKLPFGIRWNMRDIVRHKSRTAMSILGILGCVVIVVAVLGMKDTLDSFLDLYYDKAINYESRIYLSDDADISSREDLVRRYDGDSSRSISVQIDDEAVSLDIYDVHKDMVKLIDDDGKDFSIDDSGAYICRRIADSYDLDKGDEITVSPYGTDDNITMKISGIIRSTTKSIVITRSQSEKLGLPYIPDSVYTDLSKEEIPTDDAIKSVQSKSKLMESFDSFMEILYTMIFMFIGGGIILGIVVLYNLGIMSYTERYREMATLKVLGFKDKKIRNLLVSQNFWVSVFGIIIGMPLGYAVLYYLMKALAPEYELIVNVNLLTYVIGAAVTFAVTLAVGFMVSNKNKRIDMVEALKGTE